MKDWLLKEEYKAKVGRPKLADDDIIRKAKISIIVSLSICLVMCFSLFSFLKNESPLELFYSLTFEKILGMKENPNGFTEKSYYNSNGDFAMELKASPKVSSYSGYYKYTLYKLDGNEWKEQESNNISCEKDSFKVVIKTLKNKNQTWKIKLQVLNASKIEESYAPSSWKFIDSKKQEEKYAYKIFTVRGYYSPVPYDEVKEALGSKNKITITTDKENPRNFVLNVPKYHYDVIVKYKDVNGKDVLLTNSKDNEGKTSYVIPNLSRSTKVTFKVWLKEDNAWNYKLSNWDKQTDSNGNKYITTSYLLKPEANYKN